MVISPISICKWSKYLNSLAWFLFLLFIVNIISQFIHLLQLAFSCFNGQLRIQICFFFFYFCAPFSSSFSFDCKKFTQSVSRDILIKYFEIEAVRRWLQFLLLLLCWSIRFELKVERKNKKLNLELKMNWMIKCERIPHKKLKRDTKLFNVELDNFFSCHVFL